MTQSETVGGKVSVVLPTFRRPDRLKRAVDSVIRQTYKHCEVLVVNDDSEGVSDVDVAKVIQDFADERIKLFKNERTKGGNGARNTGVIHSTGEYIAFLDDDDVWSLDRLSVLTELLREDMEKKAIITAIEVIDENAQCDIVYDCDSFSLDDFLMDRYGIGASSNLFFRKSFIDQVGLWNEDLSRYQDLEYMVRILSLTDMPYCKKVLLTVFGHNEPKAKRHIIDYHLKYISSIASYVEGRSRSVQRRFYAYQYRTVALALLRTGETKDAFRFTLRSLRCEILFRTHFRFFLVLLGRVFRGNFEKLIGYR